MNKVLVTQRIDHISDYEEKRDSIDQRWTNFLMEIGLFPIFASNNINHVKAILKNEDIKGIILTGGGNLSKYGGIDSERDQLESFLLDWAINSKTTLLGVCRGMQVLQDNFGLTLYNINNHVGIRHKLTVNQGFRMTKLINSFKDVNSFHNLGTENSCISLPVVATSQDNIVMALEHETEDIYGVMWHPERENPFKDKDQELFKYLFC